MTTGRWAALALGLVLTLAAVLASLGSSTALSLPFAGTQLELPSILFWLTGAAASLILGSALLWDSPWLRTVEVAVLDAGLLILALLVFGYLMILATAPGPDAMAPGRAALVFLCGTLALLAGMRTFALLRRGRPIQFDTNWGGLGGGMGGWRISPPAAFAALAVIFLSAAVTIALVEIAGKPPSNDSSNNSQSNDTAPPEDNSSANETADDAAANQSEGNAVSGNSQ